jgi:hypothetical protein
MPLDVLSGFKPEKFNASICLLQCPQEPTQV